MGNLFINYKKNYVYELRCELFRYGDEVIDTDIEVIDDNIQEQGYIQTLTLVGIGSTATAVTTVNDGGLQYIRLIDDGYNYTESNPIVAISSA